MDTLIDSLVSTANSALADWCLFPPATAGAAPTLEATAYTVYSDGPLEDRPEVLRTWLRPITTLTSVKQDTSGDGTYATTVSSSSYVLDGVTGEIIAKAGSGLSWGSGFRYLQVVHTVGYNTGAHVVLTQAIGLLVSHWLAGRRSTGLVSLTQGGQSLTLDSRVIPIHVQQLMWPYRLIGLER